MAAPRKPTAKAAPAIKAPKRIYAEAQPKYREKKMSMTTERIYKAKAAGTPKPKRTPGPRAS